MWCYIVSKRSHPAFGFPCLRLTKRYDLTYFPCFIFDSPTVVIRTPYLPVYIFPPCPASPTLSKVFCSVVRQLTKAIPNFVACPPVPIPLRCAIAVLVRHDSQTICNGRTCRKSPSSVRASPMLRVRGVRTKNLKQGIIEASPLRSGTMIDHRGDGGT